jgi:hypothetical protein
MAEHDTDLGSMNDSVRKRTVDALFVAAAVLAVSLPLLDRGVVSIDEGQVANFAQRIAGGEVLYRDMYTGIAPGIYYLTAALFSVFGADLIVTRWAALALNLLTALCLWRLSLGVVRRGWALLPPLAFCLIVVWGYPVGTMFAYSALSLLCALAAILFLLRYLETSRALDAVAVGALLAASALSKQNYGVLAAAAVLYGVIDGWAVERPKRRLFAMLAPIVATGATVTAIVLAYFAATGALPMMLRYTAGTILESQLASLNQPIPPILGPHPAADNRFVFLYTPGVLFNYLLRGELLLGHSVSPFVRSLAIRLAYGGALGVLVVAPLVVAIDRLDTTPTGRSKRRIIVVAGALLFLGIFPSAVWSHLIAILPALLPSAAIVAQAAYDALSTRSRALARLSLALGGALVVVLLVVSTAVVRDLRRWNSERLRAAGATLLVTAEQKALYDAAVDYLQTCAPPGEPVFVAPDQPLLYFLAGRPNATPYAMLLPGDIDQDLLISRMEASHTRCGILNPRMYLHFGELHDLFPRVADYFDDRFERVREIRQGFTRWYCVVRRSGQRDSGA